MNLYPWYYLPVSVHTILSHGSKIIKYALLPIGQLSEEAQEARNKVLKRYREYNTRKNSRLHTMQDLLNNLLVSSDPIITNLRQKKQKVKTPLSYDAKQLLVKNDLSDNEEVENLNTDDEHEFNETEGEDEDEEDDEI